MGSNADELVGRSPQWDYPAGIGRSNHGAFTIPPGGWNRQSLALALITLLVPHYAAAIPVSPLFTYSLTMPTDVSVKLGESITVMATFTNLSPSPMSFTTSGGTEGSSFMDLDLAQSVTAISGGFSGNLLVNVKPYFNGQTILPFQSLTFPILYYDGSFQNSGNVYLNVGYNDTSNPSADAHVFTAGPFVMRFYVGEESVAGDPVTMTSYIYVPPVPVTEPVSSSLLILGIASLAVAKRIVTPARSPRSRPFRRQLLALLLAACLLAGLCASESATADTGIKLLTLTGAGNKDYFGFSATGIGDVNRDGYNNIFIGALGNDSGGFNAGRAYIYYGGKTLDAVPDVVFTGPYPYEYFGECVASAGDVNGDGYPDVLVSSPVRYPGGNDYAPGEAYLYLMGPNTDPIPDITFTEGGANDYFGDRMAAADINGDGYSDVLIAADNSGGGRGSLYAYYGGPVMDAVADITFVGEEPNNYFGSSVSGIGDFNGDGYQDIIVGAFGNATAGQEAGRAYVFYGGPTLDSIADLILTGEEWRADFGRSVSGAGDVNGDGFADVIVGSPSAIQATQYSGRAYVYFGGSSPDAVADLVLDSESAGDHFGWAVSSAGDVNRDGYADVLVGAVHNDAGGKNSGRAYIYLGGPSADSGPDYSLTVAGTEDWFGWAVSAAGDMNGDGYDDVAVGTNESQDNDIDVGRAYVFTTLLGAKLKLDPDVINTSSSGRWVTAYIEPFGFDPTRIDISTVRLMGTLPVDAKFASVADHDGDGVRDLMVKFSRPSLVPLLSVGVNRLTLTGQLATGEPFEGRAEVRVNAPSQSQASGLKVTLASTPGRRPVRVAVRDAGAEPLVLDVYDVQGRLVKRSLQQAVDGSMSWDGRRASGETAQSGVYFLRIVAGRQGGTLKVILMK